MADLRDRDVLILFDIDDTLVDHSAAVRAGVASLHAAIRPPAPLPDFLASWRDAMIRHFPRYLSGEATYQDQRRARRSIGQRVEHEAGRFNAAQRRHGVVLALFFAGARRRSRPSNTANNTSH